MIDSHAHLVDNTLDTILDELLQNFSNQGGCAVLNVGHNPDTNLKVLAQAQKYKMHPVKLYCAVGLHPELFSPNSLDASKYLDYEETTFALNRFTKFVELNLEKIDALGETGLDYYNFFIDGTLPVDQQEKSRELQLLAFRKHCELALKYNFPLSIHVRDRADSDLAIEDALKVISEVGKGSLTGSFHSYTGNIHYLDDILNLGFYIGINPIITYRNAENVREICAKLPLERLLLETDTPWLPPHEIRNDKKLGYRKGQPADIYIMSQKIAEIKLTTVETILQVAKDNFERCFKIKAI